MSDEQQPISDEDVVLPRGHARRQRRARRWPIAAAVLGLIALAGVGWYELQVHPLSSSSKGWTTIEVHAGEGMSAVSGSLRDAGVISSPLAMRIYTTIHGAPALRAGSYAFHAGSGLPTVKATLDAPPNAHRFDLPAGFTLAEVAKRIRTFEPRAFVQSFKHAYETVSVHPTVAPTATTLEGKVAPGIYEVLPGETAGQLLTEMVQRFDAMARSVGMTSSTTVEGHDVLQVIDIASIVQKEGYYTFNMPKVSRTIYNRLAKNMPLQMDSTVLYSLGQDGGPVTAATLKIDTPYNTYLHGGLPPTPIATPSREALAAAMHPPAGPWLYFVVVDKNGTEAFSATYAEQLKNQALARERGL